MLFQKGRRSQQVRQIKNLVLLLVMTVNMAFALTVFGQEQTENVKSITTNEASKNKTDTEEKLRSEDITTQKVSVIKSAKNLRDYVPLLFPKISVDDVQDALVENYPAIRFYIIQSDRRFEMVLVEYPKDLVLYGLAREEILKEENEGDLTATNETSKDFKIDLEANRGTSSCGGVYSANNPYPCCPNGGNCTWWAWHRSTAVFNSIYAGNNFPTYASFGDAKTWANNARNYGFPVSSEPGSRTVGVNSWMSGYGHVFFNEILHWNQLVTSEMQCYSYYGPRWSVIYDRWRANLGFIYPKPTWWKPRVSATVQPTIYAGTNPVWILFNGQNFTTDTIVDAVAPDGSIVSLSGSQLYRANSSSLWMQAVLNMRGYWKFKVVGKDGQRSDWSYIWVN